MSTSIDDDPDPDNHEPPDPDHEQDPEDYEPPDQDNQEPDPEGYEPPDPDDQEPDPEDYEPPNDQEPHPEDYEPPDPADYEPDPADFESADADDGPDWSEEVDFDLYQQQIYDDAVAAFTGQRLQSYYVDNPNLAEPALDCLNYAQSLLPNHPRAALVFAVTATELAIKVVLLRPIVSGLVHAEGLAAFISDLTTQHTGMDRFQELLTAILARFGGVNLKTYKRTPSSKMLWQEIGDVQKARNAVIHRGETAKESAAHLAIAVATTLLKKIFPLILGKLDLHLHDPMTVCGQNHPKPLEPPAGKSEQ